MTFSLPSSLVVISLTPLTTFQRAEVARKSPFNYDIHFSHRPDKNFLICFLYEFTCYLFQDCDHRRAPKYFLASVEESCSWKAYPCANYNRFLKGSCTSCNGECPSLGFDADLTKKGGSFYLQTTSKDPFCGTM